MQYLPLAAVVTLFGLTQLFLLVKVKGWTAVKLILPIMTAYFGTAIAFSYSDVKGYPTDAALPKKARVIAVDIREPYQEYKGAIYVLLNVIEEYPRKFWTAPFYVVMITDQPRLYALPYTKRNQSQFERARRQIQDGNIVEIDGDGNEEGKGNGSNGTTTSNSGTSADGQTGAESGGIDTNYGPKPKLRAVDPRKPKK